MNASQQEFKVCFAKNTPHFGYKLGGGKDEIFLYFLNVFLATVQNQISTAVL